MDLQESAEDDRLKSERHHGTTLAPADVNYFRSRMYDRDRRHMDREVSANIRKAIIPKLLLMLHEVYYSTSSWLLKVADMTEAVGGAGMQPQGHQLQRLAVKHIQSSLQVCIYILILKLKCHRSSFIPLRISLK